MKYFELNCDLSNNDSFSQIKNEVEMFGQTLKGEDIGTDGNCQK
jgi:hypothetical protein